MLFRSGCGQAAPVPGEVWERVSLSEVRVCAGAAAGLRGVAGEVLQGMQGALREYGAVYGEGGGWAHLSSGVGSLCTLFEVVRGIISGPLMKGVGYVRYRWYSALGRNA